MKKKSSNSQQIMTLVVVLSILVVVIVYVLGYKKFVDKAATMRASNNELAVRVATLKEYFENQSIYIEKMDEYKAEVKSALNEYSEEVREEDIMMLAVHSMENAEKVAYTAIAIVDPEVIYSIPAEDVIPVELSETEGDKYSEKNAINVFKRESSYVASCDYVSLKSMIKDVIEKPEKTMIKNLLFEKDDDKNNIKGTMEVAFYYVPQYGQEYVPVDMAEYTKGLESLFKFTEEKDVDKEEEKKE